MRGFYNGFRYKTRDFRHFCKDVFYKIKDSLFKRTPNTLRPKGVIVFGSSSSEVFDYIFGDNPNYYPFWLDGWSARGLRNYVAQRYVKELAQDIDRESLVLLCFGNTDIFRNLAYKIEKEGDVCLETYAKQVAEGILVTKSVLQNMGFKNIYTMFYTPIPMLSPRYWKTHHIEKQVAVQDMVFVLKTTIETCAEHGNCLNYIKNFSYPPDSYITSPQFLRQYEDFHLDYIKMQKIFWQLIRELPNILPLKDGWHEEIYAHYDTTLRVHFKKQLPRIRTCRN